MFSLSSSTSSSSFFFFFFFFFFVFLWRNKKIITVWVDKMLLLEVNILKHITLFPYFFVLIFFYLFFIKINLVEWHKM